MKLNSILSGAVIMFCLVCSCQEVEQEIVVKGSEVTFVASTEETKVTISDNYRTLYWSAADAISVLDGTSNVHYETSEEGTKVRFTSETGISDEAEDVFAVYPYSEAAHRIDDGVQVVMPVIQTVSAPGFDSASSLAVAYTSTISQQTTLNFKNLCSYFKFTVPSEDEVIEVVLRGGEKEYLAGKVNVKFDKGIPSFTVAEGLSEITFRSLTPMDGTYIVPLLPCVLQNGLSVTLKSKDGRSAVHKVVAKDETGLESAVTFVRGKINRATLGFDQPKWRSAPVAEVVAVAASTVTVRWSENDFASADADFAGRYHIALYSDESCSSLVKGMDFEMSSWANVKYPAFCFTSLSPSTDYWFVVTDKDTEASCVPLKVTTSADEFLTVGQNAAEGSVILNENFSELFHGGDPVNVAWGYGEEGFIAPKDLINWNTVDMTSMRLASWKEKTEGANYAGPGYIRVGDSSSQKNAILTPELASLNACATVEVSFKAAPYSSDYGVEGNSRLGECYAEVWVVNGDKQVSAGVVELNDTPAQWTTCTINAVNVLPDSRIAIGGAFGEKTQESSGKQYCRIYLDDVQVKLLRYEEVVAVVPPEVEIKKTFWSDSFIEWTCGGSPKGYRVYVGDQMVAELAADVAEYHITGLDVGKTYGVKVSALYNDSDEGFSRPVSLTTGAISQLTRNVGPTSVSVGIENRAGNPQTNNAPLLYVELYDTDNLSAAPTPLYSTYVLDAQIQSPGSPIVASKVLANNSLQNDAPINLAFGGLDPQKSYWFRVKSEATYTFKSYVSTVTDVTVSSPNGSSEYSELIELKTTASHVMADNEVLFQGFDGVTLLSDMVNSAAGTVPGLKRDGQTLGSLTGVLADSWTGTWSFAVLRTGLGSTQFAQFGGKTQLNSTNHKGPFVLNNTNSNATVTTPAFCKGAKMYMLDSNWHGLDGWMLSNGTWPGQGYVQVGSYYAAGDGKDQRFGFISTPALLSDKLGSEERDCVISFKALAIQGRGVTLYIGRHDGSSWIEPVPVNIHNSAGLTANAETWSSSDDSHKWYEYKVEMKLKNGDIVVFANDVTNKNGTALLDDISIKINQ